MYIFLIFEFLAVLTTAGTTNSFAENYDISANIPGKYIVKFRNNVMSTGKFQLKSSLSSKPDHDYSIGTFHGFSGSLSAKDIQNLQKSDLIDYIEQDSRVWTTALVQQQEAPWGLSRLSDRQPSGKTYSYDSSAGMGTCVYIIDTGIATEHPEFEGRAKFLVDLSGEDTLIDGDGHGTHVAGIVGSKTYGVAKKTNLLAIKVLDSGGSGTNSGVIKGFEYAVKDIRNRTSQCSKGFAANISLGGPYKKAVNEAVAQMVVAGIFVSVASGNEFGDTSNFSPSSEPTVCTVGASAANETLPRFSNTGELVDIIAPGVNITSTFLKNGSQTYSGTSMSSPHIAGLGAYLLSLGSAKRGKVCETIQQLATKDALKNVPKDTKNLLAYNGASE